MCTILTLWMVQLELTASIASITYTLAKVIGGNVVTMMLVTLEVAKRFVVSASIAVKLDDVDFVRFYHLRANCLNLNLRL